MKYTKDDFDKAEWIARNMLEGGLAFERKPLTTFLRVKRFRKEPERVPVYDSEQVRELRLMPTEAFAEAAQKALLAQHEAYQRARDMGKKAHRATFYRSKDWLAIRYQVLSERGAKCECCGASAKDGAKMHVDHIKPRSLYPDLELDKSNLQILCGACNLGKSNRHEDDWRHDKPKRILRKMS